MLRGAVPSARQYELFAFARGLARVDASERPRIQTTERFHPLVGEHLSAFAAFLGRPFREYDFYVGIYDASYFIARRYLCRPASESDSLSQQPPDSATRVCIRRALEEIVAGKHLTLGVVAPTIMRSLLLTEFDHVTADSATSVRTPAETTSRDDTLRVRMLQRLAAAIAPLRPPGQTYTCKSAVFSDAVLCGDGFEQLLRKFRSEEVLTTARQWSESPACSDSARLLGPDDCYADRTFVALVDDPNAFANVTLERLLRRIWSVERLSRAPKGPQSAYEKIEEAIEFWYRSSNERYRSGIEADPSTIPSYETFPARFLTFVVPYQVGLGLWGRTYVYTWRPTIYLPHRVLGLRTALVAPLEYSRYRFHDADRFHHHKNRYEVGAGVAVQVPFFMFNGVQLHGFTTSKFDEFPRFRSRSYGAEADFLLAGGKLKLGLRQLPKSSLTLSSCRVCQSGT